MGHLKPKKISELMDIANKLQMVRTLIITREHVHLKMTDPIVTAAIGACLEISRTMARATR
jgi:hypothetical protein